MRRPRRHRRRVATTLAIVVGLVASGCRDDGATTAPSPSTTATTATTDESPAPSGPGPGGPTTSTAGPGALGEVAVALAPVVELDRPIALAVRAGDPALYVASQVGTVHRVVDGRLEATPVLDLRAEVRAGGEQGLLGLAFGPDGTYGYVDYTDRDGNTRVEELPWSASGPVDAGRRRVVLTQTQPYANHNGGNLVFGPDGMLYVGLGDGGSAGDPQRRAGDLATWLGKLLRIDPRRRGGAPYGVPADNPFVDRPGALPEIWALGLRNPWRFSFDRTTGDLWVADVGQGALEEIDRVALADARGADFGWSAFEGTRRFNDDVAVPAGVVVPVYEYPHGPRGCSITGGFVYRGADLPGLVGAYVYADYCAPGIWALRVGADGRVLDEARLEGSAGGVASFGEGPDGELYVLRPDEGTVSRLAPG